jgi:hypothetical protein
MEERPPGNLKHLGQNRYNAENMGLRSRIPHRKEINNEFFSR